MMKQYMEIKNEYEDAILMFRLGDFYEMFHEDAKVASKILQITLTARGKSEDKTPMCGVPFHAVDQYISKLTRSGKKVALCDQVSQPDGKGIVEREVIRVITPGTTFDENILEQKSNNYLATALREKDQWGFAFADLTTGEFKSTIFETFGDLLLEIKRVRPAELLVEKELRPTFAEKLDGSLIYPQEPYKNGRELLMEHFEVNNLKSFKLEEKSAAIKASATLLHYLLETQKTELKHIHKISYYQVQDFMPLSEITIRNLELFFNNFNGQREGSLLGVLDETNTAMGGRMLRSWLRMPLIDKAKINNRLNKVACLVNDSLLLQNLRAELSELYDIERLLSRLSLGSGNARDMLALKQSLEKIPKLKELINDKDEFKAINKEIFALEELRSLIEEAIDDETPASLRDGGMIRDGYNQELDDLRSISTKVKTFIKNLQEREIKRTGVNSLKVKFNKVFGYYIEISKANLDAVPEDYIRKQTLVNSERYIIPELKEYEEKVLSAEDKIKDLEYEIFHYVRMQIVERILELQRTARAIAGLDVLGNFAYLANKNHYCKPELVDDNVLKITEGRHPVVEANSKNRSFVPNSLQLDDKRKLMLITGPNMGGKSTYLRQNALIVLLAQIGSYVPAESVEMGIVDQIFTRVGASDNLSAGESTFMVEMTEAAMILNHATDKSLIILDEIGRGTSTYDGVSIAWAISEYIHNELGAKTLFATHYHELIDLAEELDTAINTSVMVRENAEEGVIFLYQVVEGGVDKSYGIEVAKLAGMPKSLIMRARGVLGMLEEKHLGEGTGVKKVAKAQMEFFGERAHSGLDEGEKATLVALKEMDLNNLTPLEALNKLHQLRKTLLP